MLIGKRQPDHFQPVLLDSALALGSGRELRFVPESMALYETARGPFLGG